MNALRLNDVFRGTRIPRGLATFEDDPDAALHDLLLGRSSLGSLAPAEPAQLLLDWLEGIGEPFVSTIDGALAHWIESHWGEPVLPGSAESPELSADAWSRAFEVIASAERLPTALGALRHHMPEQRAFLSLLRSGRSRDPEGSAWLALARQQNDRSLASVWWWLVQLPPDAPWYYGALGIRGLRGLPEGKRGSGGGFPHEVAMGLAKLANALADRCEDGWLEKTQAEKEFLRTARTTMWAYNWHERWLGFWREQLAADQGESQLAASWIRQLFPGKLEVIPETIPAKSKHHREPPRSWIPAISRIVSSLNRRQPNALKDADALLHEQQHHAEQTGETHFVVRSACNFAKSAREWQPQRALEWVQLAHRFEPDNAFAWTTETSVLLQLDRFFEARRRGFEAVRRFPYDPVTHNTLGEVLHRQGRLADAEAVYREATHRFTDNPVARNGLAEVLRAQGFLDEAESLYRQVLDQERHNTYAQAGLRRISQDRKARAAASEVAKPQARYEASPEQNLGFDEVEILVQDAFLVRRWVKAARQEPGIPGQWRDRARSLLERLGRLPLERPEVANERGLLGIELGEIEGTLSFLRLAAERFSNSARIRYALARAERAKVQTSGKLPYDGLLPWKRLTRIDDHLRVVQLLGEGRSFLLASDAAAEEEARNRFGELGWRIGRILGHRTKATAASDPNELPFLVSWAQELRNHLFGGAAITGIDDLPDLDILRHRIAENATELDQQEESLTYRSSAA